jgi:hypothetical protein
VNLQVGVDDGGTLLPGEYEIPFMPSFPASDVWLWEATYEPDGGYESPSYGGSGTVTFTSVTLDRMSGSFSVMLVSRDGGTVGPLSGTFDSTACAP